MFIFFLFTLVFLFVAAKPAHAYLDPGTGSYITQVLIGLVAGGGYLIKVYWGRITLMIKSWFSKSEKDEKKKDN